MIVDEVGPHAAEAIAMIELHSDVVVDWDDSGALDDELVLRLLE